ncbi:hypothetical protein GEMRC1_012967 [Eukaryota sp. GEM-RC1]
MCNEFIEDPSVASLLLDATSHYSSYLFDLFQSTSDSTISSFRFNESLQVSSVLSDQQWSTQFLPHVTQRCPSSYQHFPLIAALVRHYISKDIVRLKSKSLLSIFLQDSDFHSFSFDPSPNTSKISPIVPLSRPTATNIEPCPLDLDPNLTETQLQSLLDAHCAALNALPDTQSSLCPPTQAGGSPPITSVKFSTISNPLIFSSNLSKPQLQEISTWSSSLGYSVTSKWTPKVTHLVTTVSNNRVKRTIKYLQALISNSLVVDFDWLVQSLTRKKLLDETPFIPHGDGSVVGGPMTAFNKKKRGERSLFSKWGFYLVDRYSFVDRRSVEMLVRAGGGEVLSKPCKSNQKVRGLIEEGKVGDVINKWTGVELVCIDWFLKCCAANSLIEDDKYRVQ